jgi:hypothetical protein
MTMSIIFLVLLLGGIFSLVGGLVLTRLTWRSDIEPFGRKNYLFHVALHPERFAKPDRLREIRLLNLIGGILICGALVVVVTDIVAALSRS